MDKRVKEKNVKGYVGNPKKRMKAPLKEVIIKTVYAKKFISLLF